MKICVGIVSYLPEPGKIRDIRTERLKNLIMFVDKYFKLPIILIAQNYKDLCIETEYSKIYMYKYEKPLGIVGARKELQRVFISSEFDNLIIMSVYAGGLEGRQEKIAWMNKYLPNCLTKNPPFLIDYRDSRTKADFIKDYAKNYNIDLGDCLIIDDKKKILQECKKEGIQTLYPQQVICMYEEFKMVVEND